MNKLENYKGSNPENYEKKLRLRLKLAKEKEYLDIKDVSVLSNLSVSTIRRRIEDGMKDGCLHCLRHTYAVMSWITSNDIYEVKNHLGHTSVKTTEKYAQFNMDRLAQDFPSAYQVRLEVEKVRKNAISTPLISTPMKEITESSLVKSSIAVDC